MPAGNAYPSGHLLPFPIVGLACAPIVETRFLELALSLLDFYLKYPLVLSRFCFLCLLFLPRNFAFLTKQMRKWQMICPKGGVTNPHVPPHFWKCGGTSPRCLPSPTPLYSQIAGLYILLKRSLESIARISLYNGLQTPAYSERIDRSSYNF